MKKLEILVLTMAVFMLFAACAPVFAKNMHMPAIASDVVYLSGEGVAIVDLPSGAIPLKPTATKMLIGTHIDVAPAKYVGVRLYVELWEIPPTATSYSWQPWAEVLTNPAMALLIRQFWGGTAAEFDAAVYGITAEPLHTMMSADNVFLVGANQLTVERHGNNIVVNLATPQTVKEPLSTSTWILPAFSMKLDAYGGSVHKETAYVMSGWPGAWGGTLVAEQKGFNANGAFTCPAWGLNAVSMTEGWVTMQSKQTFYPPP